jgi:hypothetical protein
LNVSHSPRILQEEGRDRADERDEVEDAGDERRSTQWSNATAFPQVATIGLLLW